MIKKTVESIIRGETSKARLMTIMVLCMLVVGSVTGVLVSFVTDNESYVLLAANAAAVIAAIALVLRVMFLAARIRSENPDLEEE